MHQECRRSIRLRRPKRSFIDWFNLTDVHQHARIAAQSIYVAVDESDILGGEACRIDRPIKNHHKAIEHDRAVSSLLRVIEQRTR